jgi:hypothetical protein
MVDGAAFIAAHGTLASGPSPAHVAHGAITVPRAASRSSPRRVHGISACAAYRGRHDPTEELPVIKRIIIGVVLVALLVGGGVAIGASIDGGWGRRDVVVHAAEGTGTGQTVVVTEHHGPHGFFPFGLLFVGLAVLLVVTLVRRGRGRGPWSGGGPRGPGGDPAWLEDWHRRAHEGDARAGEAEPTAT